MVGWDWNFGGGQISDDRYSKVEVPGIPAGKSCVSIRQPHECDKEAPLRGKRANSTCHPSGGTGPCRGTINLLPRSSRAIATGNFDKFMQRERIRRPVKVSLCLTKLQCTLRMEQLHGGLRQWRRASLLFIVPLRFSEAIIQRCQTTTPKSPPRNCLPRHSCPWWFQKAGLLHRRILVVFNTLSI
jgi:hypothetical protein